MKTTAPVRQNRPQMAQSLLAMILCAGLLGMATAETIPPANYRFTLDGKPITPQITPVFGEEGAPANGDVVRVDDFLLVLGAPGDHVFRRDGKDRLLGHLPGMDAEACVAVRVQRTKGKDGKRITVDSLSPMTGAEKALLRGVTIKARPDDLDGALAEIHWEHAILVTDHRIEEEGIRETLPPLPSNLRYLDLKMTMMLGPEDVRSLQPLRELLYLSLNDRVELDLNLLTCGPELRFFDIGGATLTHLEAIAGWTAIRNISLRSCDELKDIDFLNGLGELRSLDLSGNKDLKDIGPVATLSNLTYLSIGSWGITNLSPVAELTNLTHLYFGGSQVTDLSPVAGLSKLTHLGLSYTQVTDLSPIGRLPNLKLLDADNSAVDTLPSNPVMPKLDRATLLMTPLSVEAVAAFQKAVPMCRIHHTLEGALLAEVAGADRLRVRTGGTCHRRIAQEKTLFEIKGPEQVHEVLRSITLVEPDGWFGACMCCGNPSFEIYRGEELMTTIGFHHASSLRWSDGWWPGDIQLTEPAADYLCALLAEHGYGGPLAEHENRKRRIAEHKRRRALVLQHITGEQYDAWKKAYLDDENERLKKMATEALPNPEERAATLYTLFGLYPSERWGTYQDLDAELQHVLLATIDIMALHAVLHRDNCPEQVLQGVTRRLFSGWNKTLAETLDGPLFEKLAAWALRHPSESNRRRTVMTLAEMKEEDATRVLVRFLHEPPTPRQSAAPEDCEPEKPFSYPDPNEIALDPFAPDPPDPAPTPVPTPFIPRDGISELGAAALLLAQHGYPDALAEIRKLAAKTEGEERKVLNQAAAILSKPAKKSP